VIGHELGKNMTELKDLETIFEQNGLEALLPQNLPDKLLNKLCSLLIEFHSYSFNNQLRANRAMQEMINPASGRPYANATVFLLQQYCRVDSIEELFETLEIITKEEPFGAINIFLTLQAHYLLEQAKRYGRVIYEPLPTVNDILVRHKQSKKFKVILKHYFHLSEEDLDNLKNCSDIRYHCFNDDPPASLVPWTVKVYQWVRDQLSYLRLKLMMDKHN
jgi:hypothetical protein